MDFLEFLKSGSEGSHNRVRFDGRIFKKENDTYPEYELYSNGTIMCSSYCSNNYELFCWNADTFHSGNEYRIRKNGSLTNYSIELRYGYVTLKECGSTVYSYEKFDNSSFNGKSENNNHSSYNSSGSNGNDSFDDEDALIAGLFYGTYLIPFISFIHFMNNISNTSKRKNILHLVFNILWLFGWFAFVVNSMAVFKSSRLFAIALTYVIAYVINIVAFIINTKLYKNATFVSDKNKKLIHTINIIYPIIFVVAIILEIIFLG